MLYLIKYDQAQQRNSSIVPQMLCYLCKSVLRVYIEMGLKSWESCAALLNVKI